MPSIKSYVPSITSTGEAKGIPEFVYVSQRFLDNNQGLQVSKNITMVLRDNRSLIERDKVSNWVGAMIALANTEDLICIGHADYKLNAILLDISHLACNPPWMPGDGQVLTKAHFYLFVSPQPDNKSRLVIMTDGYPFTDGVLRNSNIYGSCFGLTIDGMYPIGGNLERCEDDYLPILNMDWLMGEVRRVFGEL